MQIVIDIPEDVIEGAKSSPNYYPTYHFEKNMEGYCQRHTPSERTWEVN